MNRVKEFAVNAGITLFCVIAALPVIQAAIVAAAN